MIIKTPQNVHEILFWVIWMSFKCDLKIDLIISEPPYVKLILYEPPI